MSNLLLDLLNHVRFLRECRPVSFLRCLVINFFFRRAKQRYFWLLTFVSRRPHVRNIYLSGRMIIPGLFIPSDKYFLKNLTFVVRISTRVAASPFQSNSLRGQGEDQQLKINVLPGLPDGKARRLSLVGSEAITALHHQQCKALHFACFQQLSFF